VKVGLEAAKQQLNDAIAARPSWRDYPTKPIIDALEAKKAEIQSTPIEASRWPRRVDPETNAPVTEPYGETATAQPIEARVQRLNSAIEELKGLGPSVRFEQLRKLRAGWDPEAKAVYSSAVTPEYIKNKSAQLGAADVTGTIREHLAGLDEGTAKANAEFHLFKTMDDVLEATKEVERVRPSTGRKIVSRMTGAVVGSKVAGLVGAMAGYVLAPAAEVSIGMGVTYKLKLAAQAQKLASAIRSGNAGSVNFYSNQLRRSLAQVGVQVENLKDEQPKK
jgi:hypothetical protein